MSISLSGTHREKIQPEKVCEAKSLLSRKRLQNYKECQNPPTKTKNVTVFLWLLPTKARVHSLTERFRAKSFELCISNAYNISIHLNYLNFNINGPVNYVVYIWQSNGNEANKYKGYVQYTQLLLHNSTQKRSNINTKICN